MATVITNLLSAIPRLGEDIVYFTWGGFSVGNATLNHFFNLQYLIFFAICSLVAVHIVDLHQYSSISPLSQRLNGVLMARQGHTGECLQFDISINHFRSLSTSIFPFNPSSS